MNLTSRLIEYLYFIILAFFVFFGYIVIPQYKIQAIILIAVSIFMFIIFKIKKIRFNASIVPWLLILVLSILSLSYSISVENSINYILILVGLLTSKIFLDNCDKKDNKIPTNILYIFSFVHVIATIIYLIFPEFIQTIDKNILTNKGYIYNVNLYRYGCYAGICSDHGANAIFISIFLAIAIEKIFNKSSIKNVLMVILVIIALFLTGKRGYLIACTIALIITFIYYNKDNRQLIKKFLLIVSLASILIVILNTIPATSFVFERFVELSDEGNVLNGREDTYKNLLQNISRNPFFGSGINTTTIINNGNDGHNIYLQIFSELGILGFLLLLYLILENLMLVFKTKNYAKTSSLFFQIFFIISGITGNPLYYIPTLVVYNVVTSKYYIEK